MNDPFSIDGPAYISFSGGRTSGYMLWRVLQAHSGSLPNDVHVVFSNTGCEMPGTLDFVRDSAANWNVQIHWVEYRVTADDKPTFANVTYKTAARNHEPFDIYLDHMERHRKAEGKEPYLPGPGLRVCTTELKIRVMKKWMLHAGYDHWTDVVGFRYDEPERWRKVDRTCPKERWELEFPLVDARISVRDVKSFWANHPFDLQLRGDHEGNCDACHLKRPWKVAQVFKDNPERATWWNEREKRIGKRFRQHGPSIEQLVQMSKLPIVRDDVPEIQCAGCTD